MKGQMLQFIRAVLISAIAASTSFAQTLDQSFILADHSFSQGIAPALAAQTYTAGLTGNLTSVNLVLSAPLGTTITIQIRNVVSGQPGTTLLGSATINGPLPAWPNPTPIAFRQPIPQVSGTQYAIVVSSSPSDPPFDSVVGWTGISGSPAQYGGGNGFEGFDGTTWGTISGWDFYFQTYVGPTGPTYSCTGFKDPFDVTVLLKKKVNRAIPLQIQLSHSELAITDTNIAGAPPVVNIAYNSTSSPALDVTDELDPNGSASDGNQFSYVGGGWLLVLGTKAFAAAGTYTVTVAPGSGDYSISPTCTGHFVRTN